MKEGMTSFKGTMSDLDKMIGNHHNKIAKDLNDLNDMYVGIVKGRGSLKGIEYEQEVTDAIVEAILTPKKSQNLPK